MLWCCCGDGGAGERSAVGTEGGAGRGLNSFDKFSSWFVFGEVLGVGASAVVYRCKPKPLPNSWQGTSVCCKVIRKAGIGACPRERARLLSQLQAEVEILRLLQGHSRIAQLLGAFEVGVA